MYTKYIYNLWEIKTFSNIPRLSSLWKNSHSSRKTEEQKSSSQMKTGRRKYEWVNSIGYRWRNEISLSGNSRRYRGMQWRDYRRWMMGELKKIQKYILILVDFNLSSLEQSIKRSFRSIFSNFLEHPEFKRIFLEIIFHFTRSIWIISKILSIWNWHPNSSAIT